MDRPGNLPGGIISEIRNMHSKELYWVSTAPEIGQDYWTTAVIPSIQHKLLWGLLKHNTPDFVHQIAAFTRNSMEDAHQVHAEVRYVVGAIREDEWFDKFPFPAPPDGYSDGARARLNAQLGYDPT